MHIVTRANMAETVKFDLLGDRRLVFDTDAVTHITKEMYPIPLPGVLRAARVVTNQPIRYADVLWVGPFRRKQWWALIVGALFTLLGAFWMATSFGDWGPFAFGAVCFLLLGALPLWLFNRGRSFLAIASEQQVICIPMDRKKKQVRRALALLRDQLPTQGVRWEIGDV